MEIQSTTNRLYYSLPISRTPLFHTLTSERGEKSNTAVGAVEEEAINFYGWEVEGKGRDSQYTAHIELQMVVMHLGSMSVICSNVCVCLTNIICGGST